MKFRPIAFFLILLSFKLFGQNTLSYTEIESRYNNGLELFEKKAFAACRKEMHEYIELSERSINPNTFNIGNARYYAAVSSLNAKALDSDIEVERFVVNFPDHPKAKLIFKELANSYFERGNYDEAIEYYLKSLENRSENFETLEIRYRLGVAYYQKKDFEKAQTEFDIVKKTSTVSSPDAAYYAGILEFKRELYETSYTDLIRVENVAPYKVDVPNLLGQLLYRQKKYDELLNYAIPVIANPGDKKTDELSLLVAEVYYDKDNFEKAALYFNRYKALKKVSNDLINFKHAYSFYKTNNYSKAAAIFKIISNQNTELGQQSAYYLGISSLKTADLNAALLAFEQAKKQTFDKGIKEEASYNYIKVLLEKNNSQKAMTELQAYLKEFPNGKYENESNEFLSEILSETNSYTSAIQYIESLKNRTPKINEAYQKHCFNAGIQEFNQEKYEKAIVYFEKSLNFPISKELVENAKYWRAEAFAQSGKPEAKALFASLVKSPNTAVSIKSQYGYAYLLFNNKDYLNASEEFSEVLEKAKKTKEFESYEEDARIRVADCFLSQKKYSEALKLYDYAYLNGKSDKDYTLYQKGLVLKYLDRDTESKEVFEKFNKIFTNSRLLDDALFQSASLDIEKGSYASAIQTLSEILRKKPNSTLVPMVLLKRAISYSNIQKYDLALNDFKLILNKFPLHPVAEEALLGTKEALNSLNRSEEFAEIANNYRKSNPSSNSAQDLQFEAAKDLYFAEKYEKAISALQQFVVNNASDANVPESKFLIAESYYILGKTNEALSYYEELVNTNQIAYLAKSAMRAGDLYYKMQSFDRSLKNYQEVLNSNAGERELKLAQEGIYKSHFYKNEFDKCIEACNKVALDNSSVVLNAQNRALLWKGKALKSKKEFQAAKQEFQKVVSLAKDESGAEAKVLFGEIQYMMKEYDNSIKTLQEFASDFSGFENWYEKAFLLISDNYIAKNDIFMAKATLNSIISNSENKETIEIARQKLNMLPK